MTTVTFFGVVLLTAKEEIMNTKDAKKFNRLIKLLHSPVSYGILPDL